MSVQRKRTFSRPRTALKSLVPNGTFDHALPSLLINTVTLGRVCILSYTRDSRSCIRQALAVQKTQLVVQSEIKWVAAEAKKTSQERVKLSNCMAVIFLTGID